MDYSYKGALEAAGAEVLAFEEFGSYQGDWWAKVRYGNQEGWVRGYYGSCSGCDAIEAEFGFDQVRCDVHSYDYTGSDACPACGIAKAKCQERYISMGEKYLDGIMSTEEALKDASENLEWDMDAQEMVDFIKRVQ